MSATIAEPFGVVSKSWYAQGLAKTRSFEAYRGVLRAYQHYFRGLEEGTHKWARRELEESVRLDPHYSEAWAWLAEIYTDEVRHRFNPLPKSMQRAEQAAEQAVMLDPTSQVACQSLATVYFFTGRLDLFYSEAKQAIQKNPNNPWTISFLASLMALSGRWEEGRALIGHAINLIPNNPRWLHLVEFHDYYRRREYEAALDAALKANLPNFYRAKMRLAAVYGKLGMSLEAIDAVEQLINLAPNCQNELANEFRLWNYPADHAADLLDGLSLAGLQCSQP